MTFSIAAIDPETNKTGVAIASAFPAVGAVCPYVSENIALSSQSWDSGRSYGENALDMVDRGLSLPTACEALLKDHKGSPITQLHGIHLDGTQFTYTGEKAVDWAGHDNNNTHTVAGNMLSGKPTLQATSEEFENAEGPFEEQLLTALEAGEKAGGDKRGNNLSAALLVHAPKPKLYQNLRVDQPNDPINGLWDAYKSAKETESNLPDVAETDWGTDYPNSIIEFDIKY